VKAVILAGGRGTRLRPYTTIFPKPLMPIGDKPILEIIIRQLEAQGLRDIIIMVGHLSELIMAFFGDGSKFGVNIKYSKEEQPLGTAGGLALIRDELDESFLMINGDTLTTLNYSNLIHYLNLNGAITTIALKSRNVKIDFGVVEVDERSNNIESYTEKPTHDTLVSTGISVMRNDVLEFISPNAYLDFPQLIQTLLTAGETVKGYVFDGYWLDIGRPDDYERANVEIDELYNELGIGEK